MKILHVCLANFYIDNYSYQENMLPKYHKKMGYDVEILASLIIFDKNGKLAYLDKSSSYINEFGILVTRLEYKRPVFSKKLRMYKGVYNELHKSKPDIIFIHGCQFWDIGIIEKYSKENPDVRIIADFHSDYYNSAQNWISKKILHKLIWKKRIELIDHYVSTFYCITPHVLNFVKDTYNIRQNKLKILPLGADTDLVDSIDKYDIRKKIRVKLDIKENDIVIVHGAKISDEKKTIELIEAVKQLPQHVHLIIFGNVLENYKISFYNSLSGCCRIHYIGWQDTKSIYSYYKASDIACFPGGQSTLWQEAIACGLPLVCNYSKGLEYLDVGGNVLFLNGNTTDDILKGLEILIKSKEKINHMFYVSNTKGKEKFSYKTIAAKTIDDLLKIH